MQPPQGPGELPLLHFTLCRNVQASSTPHAVQAEGMMTA